MKMTSVITLPWTAALSLMIWTTSTHAFTPAASRMPASNRLFKPQSVLTQKCQQRPDFLMVARGKEIKTLPSGIVLIAKDAEYYVESQNLNEASNLQIHSYQSFTEKTSSPEVLCAQSPFVEPKRFELNAPTLIDLTHKKKVGNSLWSFQVQSSQGQASAWNRKSPMAIHNTKDLFEQLKTTSKAEARLYQLGANEYELIITQKENNTLKSISIRYDALRKFQ